MGDSRLLDREELLRTVIRDAELGPFEPVALVTGEVADADENDVALRDLAR